MIICACCGSIPAKCTCHTASPLQSLIDEQAMDARLWGNMENPTEKHLQRELFRLHKAIQHERGDDE